MTSSKPAALPPFKVSPFFRTRIWGFQDLSPWFDFKTDGEPIGEVWLTGDQCVAETGPLAGKALSDIVRDHKIELLGSSESGDAFPLLVKVLFPKEKLSVQVHPNDQMAQKYGDPRGKTECWYALDAEPGAQVALGIQPDASPDAVRRAIEDSTLEDLLAWLPVEKGDMIFVDAGTVHAIGPGVVLLETQQNSDLTYRMYDYGRPRELHVDRSIEAMRIKTGAGKVDALQHGEATTLIDVPYFRVDRLKKGGSWSTQDQQDAALSQHAQVYFVASGEATLSSGNGEPIWLGRCQTAIVPAGNQQLRIEASSTAEVIRIVPQPGAPEYQPA